VRRTKPEQPPHTYSKKAAETTTNSSSFELGKLHSALYLGKPYTLALSKCSGNISS
jgi:hypothetical protein